MKDIEGTHGKWRMTRFWRRNKESRRWGNMKQKLLAFLRVRLVYFASKSTKVLQT